MGWGEIEKKESKGNLLPRHDDDVVDEVMFFHRFCPPGICVWQIYHNAAFPGKDSIPRNEIIEGDEDISMKN